MDGSGDYCTKWSKSDRERQIPYNIVCMRNLKKERYKWTHLQNGDSQTQKTNLELPKGKGWDKLGVWD